MKTALVAFSSVIALLGDALAFQWMWNVGGAPGIDLSGFPNIVEGRVELFTTYLGHWPLIQSGGTWCNGGLPQLGNLSAHMTKVKSDVLSRINSSFDGLLVIDFESWNPSWNLTGSLYQNMSVKLVETENPSLPPEQAFAKAVQDWTSTSKSFFLGTISAIQDVVPRAKIGYYGYPTRFFYNGYCTPSGDGLRILNNELDWLWSASGALYPSIYQFYDTPKEWPADEAYVTCNLNETVRVVARGGKTNADVWPYGWPRLHEDNSPFLSPQLSKIEFGLPKSVYQPQGMQGMIIWDEESNNKTGIQALQNWLNANKEIFSSPLSQQNIYTNPRPLQPKAINFEPITPPILPAGDFPPPYQTCNL